jgi:hypothetical protein
LLRALLVEQFRFHPLLFLVEPFLLQVFLFEALLLQAFGLGVFQLQLFLFEAFFFLGMEGKGRKEGVVKKETGRAKKKGA